MNLTWIHLAKKSLRTHTLACVMTCWRPIQSFINVLSFPFLPDCSVVVFLCNTFMVFSLGFFLNFLFCQMNVQKLIPKYIWFHLYIKTCRKNDACSDVSFFLLLFIFETKLLKLISPVWSLWRMIYKLVHCEAFYFDWWVGTHAMLLSVVDSCYPTAIKGWWDIVTQQGNVRVFKLKTLKIFREVFWRC